MDEQSRGQLKECTVELERSTLYSCKTMSSEKLVCDRLTVVEQLLLYRHLLHVYHIFYSSQCCKPDPNVHTCTHIRCRSISVYYTYINSNNPSSTISVLSLGYNAFFFFGGLLLAGFYSVAHGICFLCHDFFQSSTFCPSCLCPPSSTPHLQYPRDQICMMMQTLKTNRLCMFIFSLHKLLMGKLKQAVGTMSCRINGHQLRFCTNFIQTYKLFISIGQSTYYVSRSSLF